MSTAGIPPPPGADDVLQDWISAIEGWVPMLAESLWVYPALMLFATIDGFFPPVPSESVVIALASLSVAQGSPSIVLVALAAAAGAFIGDQIAYFIGSRVDVHRLRVFRTPRGRRTLAWAEHALAHRGSSFILAARYIPIGRVAVNMTAGALGYPRRRFVGLTALAAVTWAAYGSLVGAGAGIWLADHPVIAVVAGVVVGTGVGIGIDWVLRRWTGLDRSPTPVAGAEVPADVPGPSVPAPAVIAGAPSRAPVPAVPAQHPVTSRQRSGPSR
jgi:membrane-associated protein